MKITFKNWNIEEQTGYKPLTTSYMDFSIAEPFGIKAIMGTFKDLLMNFKGNYKYLTKLTMALNWKCWEHYSSGNGQLQELYTMLYHKMDKWCMDNLKGEALEYFIRTTD